MPEKISGEANQTGHDNADDRLAVTPEKSLELVLAQRIVDLAQEGFLLGFSLLAVAFLRIVRAVRWQSQLETFGLVGLAGCLVCDCPFAKCA